MSEKRFELTPSFLGLKVSFVGVVEDLKPKRTYKKTCCENGTRWYEMVREHPVDWKCSCIQFWNIWNPIWKPILEQHPVQQNHHIFSACEV